MATYFVNTDAVSTGGVNYHDEWIQRGIAVTSGELKYRDKLAYIKGGDTVLMYVNGLGLVASGIALDDDVLDVTGVQTVNPGEPTEYHKRVRWELDLSDAPVSPSEVKQLVRQVPLHAVQRVHQGEDRLLERLSLPTTDYVKYVRLADELLQRGPIERPEGVVEPRRVEAMSVQIYRDPRVRAWALQRASGQCEMCGQVAPFRIEGNLPYLESHHIVPLSKGGPDTPDNTAALCPNCHRELHFGMDRAAKGESLRCRIVAKEPSGNA